MKSAIKGVAAAILVLLAWGQPAWSADDVGAAQLEMNAARERYESAKAEAEEAKDELDWARAEADQAVADEAKDELDRARAEADQAKAELDRARANYDDKVAKSQAELAKSGIKPGQRFKDCGTCPEMVIIPPGSFMMGSPEGEKGGTDNERPQHSVTIAVPFALGTAEVTQGEWEAVMGSNPSHFRGANRPVEKVSWNDVQVFIRKLNETTGKHYRLPSEAEWEYAARAGTTTPWSCGGWEGCLSSVAVNYVSSGDQSQPVRSKSANAFGLYDMHGNVWEWTQDCRHQNYIGAPSDGSAWARVNSCGRVIRGGSWEFGPETFRSAYRDGGSPDRRNASLGFRLVRTLP
jgi:formylglycine-generating enzyme required for sulfatase activity